ncbi:MAG: single-stranded DNA-binding protein [Patescibacteria group bacterium]
MLSLNRVMLIGNLTRDPELRYTPNGQAVASFSVATNRSYVDASGERKDIPEYTNIVTWGKLAEIAKNLLIKGRKVYVEGRLQTRSWEGQDGVKRYTTEVVAENLLVLDRPRGEGGASYGTDTGYAQARPADDMGAPAPSPMGDLSAKEEINLDDIPF